MGVGGGGHVSKHDRYANILMNTILPGVWKQQQVFISAPDTGYTQMPIGEVSNFVFYAQTAITVISGR